MRRFLAVIPLLVVAAFLWQAPSTTSESPCPVGTRCTPLSASFGALSGQFAAGKGVYNSEPNAPGDYPTAWAEIKLLGALMEAELLPDRQLSSEAKTLLAPALWALHYFWNPRHPPAAYGGLIGPPFLRLRDRWYDDNAWIGLLLLQHWRQNHSVWALRQSERLFAFVEGGWDNNPKDVDPGGVYWTQFHHIKDRNAVSTAAGAMLGLELYLSTHNRAYLQAAVRMFNWVNRYLRGPNGLYYDRLNGAGKLVPVQISYNQGLMLGCAAILYRVTGETSYLRLAQQIAAASLQRFRQRGGWQTQGVQFNQEFFRFLMLLDTVSPNPAYVEALKSYAHFVAAHVGKDGLYSGAAERPTLLNQGSAVELLALASLRPQQVNMLKLPPLPRHRHSVAVAGR